MYGRKVDFLHEKSLSVLATLASGPQGGKEGGGPDGEGDEAGPRKRRGAARAELDFGPIKVEVTQNLHFNPVLRIRIRMDPAKSERAYTVDKTVNSGLFVLLDSTVALNREWQIVV